MKKTPYLFVALLSIFLITAFAGNSYPWNDETHIAIAKAAGYSKWFNAVGADMAKLKAGDAERFNHFSDNPRGAVVTPEMVFEQVKKYNRPDDPGGHLYGAIIASVRNYSKYRKEGKYGEYPLAFCAHYVGDLSQPLHNTRYDSYNRKYHKITDGIINDEVLNHIGKIKPYPIKIESEKDLAKEIAKIANLSMKKGYQIEDENRTLTKQEAYEQISHSASLFRAILTYVGSIR